MEINIVAPDKIVFSEKNAKLVTLQGIEGNLGIMDKHTPIITFLRPGLIKIEGEINNSFFVTCGVIDFQDDKLNILTDLVFNTNEINSDVVNKLKSEAEKKLKNDNLSDKDIFISNTLINEIENLNFK